MKLYVGWDGAYVLSLRPLEIQRDGIDGTRFLCPTRGYCVDLDKRDGKLLFGHLKLKKYEVAVMTVGKGRRVKAKEAKP